MQRVNHRLGEKGLRIGGKLINVNLNKTILIMVCVRGIRWDRVELGFEGVGMDLFDGVRRIIWENLFEL